MRLVCVIAGALALANAARAQEAKDSVLRRTTGVLASGTLIRITTAANRWTGELLHVSGDTVYIGPRQQPVGVSFGAVDTLLRRGNAERLASNVGMVTLGIAGAAVVFAVYVGAAEGSNSLRGEELGAIGLGALVGAAVGWFTGALIGQVIPRWVQLYPPNRLDKARER